MTKLVLELKKSDVVRKYDTFYLKLKAGIIIYECVDDVYESIYNKIIVNM